MELNLTDWQRMALGQLVGGLRGDLARLRKGSKILDALEKAGKIPHQADPRKMENRVKVELGDREAGRLVKELVEGFGNWPMAALEQVEDLAGQLGEAD